LNAKFHEAIEGCQCMAQRLLPPLILSFVAILACGVGWTANGQPLNGAVSARGQIEGGSEIFSLGTSATGTISQLLVKPGDHVQAGQPLLRVDCRDLEGEVAARQSDLAASEAVFARVTRGSRPEEVAIGEANVNLAEARLHEAQKQFDRAQALHEGVTITRVQIDQAERDARIAEAMLEEVRAKLVLLKVGSREEDITEARARRDAAKARMDEAAARLAYCTVAAPISGVVLSTRVSPGQLVSTMAPATLITMVDDSKRRARAFVSERDIPRICLGEQGQISVDGVSGDQSEGRVENIAPEFTENPYEPGPARFRSVILSISNTQKQLQIGQMVSVKLFGCGS
jgi:multidrug resistance efflux pump